MLVTYFEKKHFNSKNFNTFSLLQTGGLKRLLKQTQTLGKSKQTLLRENQTFVCWN
jgi:hypothetical protein